VKTFIESALPGNELAALSASAGLKQAIEEFNVKPC
jgi:hypothetical protein